MGSSSKKSREKEGRRRHHRDDSSEEEKERSSRKEKKRERSRERDRSRDRNRGRERSREREKEGERSRERGKEKEKVTSRKEREKDRRKDDSDQRHHHRRRHSSSSGEEDKEDERHEVSRRREREEHSDARRVEKESARGAERSSGRRKRSRSPTDSGSDVEHPSEHKQRKLRERRGSPPRGRRQEAREKNESREEEREEEEEEEGPLLKGSGGDSSLSIEETNKLRAKLGLKPLEVDGNKQGGEEGEKATEETKKKDVHVPPKNIGDIKTAEKLRSKMETMRETRRIADKLSLVKTLGEEEEEGAAEWVRRMRQLQKEKEKAEKRAQLLAEMDEEFGVGDLVSETFQEEKRHAYSSRDLRGLKVEHELEDFREDRGVILTIKDAGVLEEGGDVLVNVNMVDDDKAKKNVEVKKGKPLYNPFEQEEEEEFELGEMKKPSLLKKYDEEIEGEKKRSFALGEGGDVDTSEQRERQLVREKLKARGISLDVAPSQPAMEYYTEEEMVQFRKPRKKKKVRKRLKADDLIPLADERTSKDHASRDHGSRRRREDPVEEDKMDTGTEAGTDPTPLADEQDNEVDNALVRTRRLLKRGKPEVSGAARVVNMLQNVPIASKWRKRSRRGKRRAQVRQLYWDATAEFCRQVGEEEEEPHRRSSSHYDEDHVEGEMELDTSVQESAGGWMEVQPTSEKPAIPQEKDLYQEAEPIVASGITAALQMATRKGFFEEGKKRRQAGETTVVYTDAQRDREYERQKERERERELSRYDRDSAFPEKKEYRPNVRIEYVDDDGRLLSTKEAFRYMSHKFHGRGSGKKKLEKRIKKFQDEHFLNKSSSVDTPLNTLNVLQAKQKASQTPYLLLSGGAQSMLAPDIAKKK